MYLNDKNNNNLYLIELNKEGYYLKTFNASYDYAY